MPQAVRFGPFRQKKYKSKTKNTWEAKRQKARKGNLNISRRKNDWRTAALDFRKSINKDEIKSEFRMHPGLEEKYNDPDENKRVMISKKREMILKSPRHLRDTKKFVKYVGKGGRSFEIARVKGTYLPDLFIHQGVQRYLENPSLAAMVIYLNNNPNHVLSTPEKNLCSKFMEQMQKHSVSPSELSFLIRNTMQELNERFSVFRTLIANREIDRSYIEGFYSPNVLAIGFNPSTKKLKVAIVDL